MLLRIAILRMKGLDISWSTHIHETAEFETDGGIIRIGAHSIVDKGVIIRAYGGRIEIGSDCSINPYSIIYGHGGLHIGNGVRVAAHTVIIPSNHIFSNPQEFILAQGETMIGIHIDDDVWLGAGVRVLDGVRIGKGSVVGAGSVVSRPLESYGIYVGAPARKIATRGNRET